MPRYDVYIPFTCSYEGEIADEEFSTIVKADNEKDAIQKALDELSSEYVVKTLNSDDITVEQIPDFPSFDEWEEKYTALSIKQSEGMTQAKSGLFVALNMV